MPQLSELFRFVFPILTGDDARPEILGTSVYCAVDRFRYLITAAHVLDQCGDRGIEFPSGVCPSPTTGAVVSSNLPESGNRADDSCDVAVLRLTDQQAAGIEGIGAEPIRIEARGVDDEAREGDEYVFTGYPSSRNRVNRTRQRIDPDTVSAIGRSATMAEFASLGREPAIHIASLYDRENGVRNGVRGIGPEAWGMSGGAIWKLNRVTGDCVFVGVGTDWYFERRFLIGTRIGAAVALMRAEFPETLAYLPVPGRFETPS